jgi:hypothetical protein
MVGASQEKLFDLTDNDFAFEAIRPAFIFAGSGAGRCCLWWWARWLFNLSGNGLKNGLGRILILLQELFVPYTGILLHGNKGRTLALDRGSHLFNILFRYHEITIGSATRKCDCQPC